MEVREIILGLLFVLFLLRRTLNFLNIPKSERIVSSFQILFVTLHTETNTSHK